MKKHALEVTVHWEIGGNVHLGGLVVFTRRFSELFEQKAIESLKTHYCRKLEPLAGPWCRERQMLARQIYSGFQDYPSEESARNRGVSRGLSAPIQDSLWRYRVYGFLWLIKAGPRLFAALLGIVTSGPSAEASLWWGQSWRPFYEAIGADPGAVIDAAYGNIDKIRNQILLRR